MSARVLAKIQYKIIKLKIKRFHEYDEKMLLDFFNKVQYMRLYMIYLRVIRYDRINRNNREDREHYKVNNKAIFLIPIWLNQICLIH